jgi:hypothetical protein
MDSIMSALFGTGARPTMRGDVEARGVDAQAELKLLLRGASQPKMATAVVKSDTSRQATLARTGSAADAEAAAAAQQQAALDAARARGPAAAPGPGSAAASAGGAPPSPASHRVPQWAVTTAYGVTNLASVVMIVVANKMVLFTHKFGFAITLTCLHAVFTAVGMAAMAAAGLFPRKSVPVAKTAPIAAVYVGFVVFNNLSIQLNPLGARRAHYPGRSPSATGGMAARAVASERARPGSRRSVSSPPACRRSCAGADPSAPQRPGGLSLCPSPPC